MKPLLTIVTRAVLCLGAVCASSDSALAAEPDASSPSAEQASAQSAPAPKGNLKILTWNIQMLPTAGDAFSESLRKGQALRAPWIIEYLNQSDYDVVVLQEVIDRPLSAKIKQELKQSFPHIVSAEPKGTFTGCCGGILFASRVPIEYLAHVTYKNIAGVDALAEKGCVLVEGTCKGMRFQIAGTHLQAGNDEVRDKEFAEIRDGLLVPHKKKGVPQFLVGDMNVGATDEPFGLLLETTDMKNFPLDDPQPFTTDGNNSWNRPGKRGRHIDHVLLNPRGTGTTIVRQTVQRARREHEGRTIDYADHYGVVAEVLIKK